MNGTESGLVGLRPLGHAVMRRWRFWVAAGVLGLLMGTGYVVFGPRERASTVAIMLAHPDGTDPLSAMATDVNLATTRAVADRVIARLNLSMTATDLQRDIVVRQTTANIMTIAVNGPDADAVQARATAFAEEFLAFRKAQLETTSKAIIEANTARASDLRNQIEQLTSEYNRIGTHPEDQVRATEVLSQRADLTSTLLAVEQSSQAATLRATSVTQGSSIIDPPAVVPVSTVRRVVLSATSGLVGGLFVGLGIVVSGALLSDRLRSRRSIAVALGRPVTWSVGPLPAKLRPIHPESDAMDPRSPQAQQRTALEVLKGLVSWDQRPAQLCVAGLVGSAREVSSLVALLGADFSGDGRTVGYVDLTTTSRLVVSTRETGQSDAGVHRPRRVPFLAVGPFAGGGEYPPGLNDPDVVLTAAEIDLGIGADTLPSWSSRIAVLIKAGASSAEQLASLGMLVDGLPVERLDVILVGADHKDHTVGAV